MKSILAVSLFAVFVAAEVPSNSYLPPTPNQAYQQSSAPSIVAARALNQRPGDHHNGNRHGAGVAGSANGFARSGLQNDHGANSQGPHARFNDNDGQGDQNAGFSRNALNDINHEPSSYNYGYMVNDHQEGTEFGHHESRLESRAQGEYHVVLPDGRKQTVSYEADERGFKPQVSYEDPEDVARSSGYDANANFRANNGYHGNEQHGAHRNAASSGYN